jgi:hypothetical protein
MDNLLQSGQQPSQSEVLDAFIDGILAQKGLPGLENEQVLRYVRQDMAQRLLDQIDKALIEALPEAKAVEFDKLLDDEKVSSEDVQGFIVDAGVDVPKVTALTMVRFRDLYLGEAV